MIEFFKTILSVYAWILAIILIAIIYTVIDAVTDDDDEFPIY